MDLKNDSFEEADIERHGLGAGIVPFSVDDTGVVRFLLGRERWMPAWKGSCRWSGFEGSRKESETMQETAVREFTEESMGVVDALQDAKNMICKKEYASRIVLKISNERYSERYHCTYLMRVPWDENTAAIPNSFQVKRSDVENIDRIIQEWKYRRPTFLDEQEVGDILDVTPSEEPNPTKKVMVRRVTANAPCILRHPWTIDEEEPEYIYATFWGDEASRLLHWDQIRSKLDRNTKNKVYECVHVLRDNVWNYVQDAKVMKDYLEKDQVKWWTTNELLDVLRARGHMGVDRFRPYFMPVLQSLLMFCIRSSYIDDVLDVSDPLSEAMLCEEVPPEAL